MKKIVQISKPGDAFELLKSFGKKRQEHFLVVTLSTAHDVIRRRAITIGTLNRTLIHPREIFWPAIKDNAAAIIIAHNHPSGHVNPSREDFDITDRLKKAADIMGIPILDHVIIGRDQYYSFLEAGSL